MHPSPNVLSVLQAGRGIAAMAVVFHHAAAYAAENLESLPTVLVAVAGRAYLGVDFFFVLSGFIIYYTNLGKPPTASWARRYLESRLVRIFVPYLPVGLAVALGYTLLPGLSASSREWSWLPTLTLLPSIADPALIVAWTLQHELVFYLLFMLFALSGRPLFGGAIWAGVIIAWGGLAGEPAKPLFILFAILNVEFFLGMAVARITATRGPRDLLFLAGAAILFALFLALGARPEHRIVFGLAIAMLLVVIVRAELSGRLRTPASLVFLGDASYSVYLVHNPLQALLSRALPGNWAIAVLWLCAAGTLLGLLYHVLYERPAIAFVRAQQQRSSRKPGEATPGAT